VVGEAAPDFTLEDQFGNEFNLYKNLLQKILLIFYPKDNTLVCSRQLSDYQMNKEEFSNLGIKLVTINSDSAEKHRDFAGNCGLDFTMLSDPEKDVCRKYNAVNLFGGIKRKMVLISKERKILFEDEVLSINYRTTEQLKSRLSNL